jgi:hypothetical protein
MSARVLNRPFRKNKSAKPPRGRARTQGGKELDVSAGRFPKASGRKPVRMQEPLVNAHVRVFGVYLN